MKKLINKVLNLVKVSKYSNTAKYNQEEVNTDKPSLKYDVEADEQGYRHYKKNGVTHRLNGPAIIYRSGASKYFIEGVELTEAEHNATSKKVLVSSPVKEYRDADGTTTLYSEEEYTYMLTLHCNGRGSAMYNKYL